MPSPADAPGSLTVEASLRALRPVSSGSSLERRLAVASILSEWSGEPDLPRLGRLEVQSRLGAGAMGVVYRAYDPQLQRLVAVKVLRGWTERSERAQIAQEARALARLNHPNVVVVHDIVEDDNGLYFTMEYVAGMTLRAWLDSHPEADWREVLEWFVQAGRGLAAVHVVGIVHRDFKPDNAIVGDDGRVRLVDFGLARVRAPEAPESRRAAGTPRYMAPEALERGEASTASDQYSYCRALGDALDGKEAPSLVISAIARGLAHEPGNRHASLTTLLDLLDGAIATSAQRRPRSLLLDRVEQLWLRGVLEHSLGESGVVDLSLTGVPALVDPPWRPWGVAAPDLHRMSSRELSHVLAESHGSLLIVGPPGAGKTTLLLILCRDLWRKAWMTHETPAPVVLSLSTYNPKARPRRSPGDHFKAWMLEELVTKYGLPRPSVGRWLDEGEIVLLLDGLDETEPSSRGDVVETLNQFRQEHPLMTVVTCRDSEYQMLETRLAFGAAVAVEPLSDAGIASLVQDRRAQHLMARLAHDGALRQQLRNPLLLMLYASGNRNDDDDSGKRPGWAEAYERYVDRAFAELSTTAREGLRAQLSFLARVMQRNNTSDLWLERLHFGWLDRSWERRLAYASGVLLVLLFGVGLNTFHIPLTEAPLASGLTFGIGVSVASFAYTRGRIRPVDKLRWSWRRAVRLLPITTVCALVIGLAEALRINFASNMAGAGITGAILGLAFALEPGERATQVSPNAGIRQSLINALRVSLSFGIPTGLAFAFVFQPYVTHPLAAAPEYRNNPPLIVGVSVGLFVLTALFLIYGGFTVIMHWVLRLWLAWRTPLPLALTTMLDRTVELGLMRRVGGGYVFLHRTLLAYFANAAGDERRERESPQLPA